MTLQETNGLYGYGCVKTIKVTGETRFEYTTDIKEALDLLESGYFVSVIPVDSNMPEDKRKELFETLVANGGGVYKTATSKKSGKLMCFISAPREGVADSARDIEVAKARLSK